VRKTRKPFVAEKTVRGRRRLYFRLSWTEDGKRRERYLPLPGDEDSPEFDAEYWRIRSGRHAALQAAPPRTSFRALVESYRASARWKRLAPRTRASYQTVLDELIEKNADKDVRRVTRAQVRAIHEKHAATPRKADLMVQVLSVLLNHARVELEWIASNPASGIRLFGAQRGFNPWPSALQQAFLRAAEAAGDAVVKTAFLLGTGTGQRPGDLVRMEWEHWDGDYIAVLQEKTKQRVWVWCPARLRAHLESTPRAGHFILAKNLTEPLGYFALEARFRKVRAALGARAEGLTMHGWRYTAAVELAEAGATDAEIQAVTGHRTLAMVQKYRAQASKKRLSRAGQERRG